MNLERIRKALESDIMPHLKEENTKHAAVLVIIYGSEPFVVMTEKPQTMTLHGGEISFPGGKISEIDSDLLDTALRETLEEISLHLSREHVIGQLEPVRTRNSGFTIIPFVCVLERIPDLVPNQEVEEILHIPLSSFLRTLEPDEDENHRSLFEAYQLTFEGKIVWGATARILKQIVDIFKRADVA